jgi:hypothetical protein
VESGKYLVSATLVAKGDICMGRQTAFQSGYTARMLNKIWKMFEEDMFAGDELTPEW